MSSVTKSKFGGVIWLDFSLQEQQEILHTYDEGSVNLEDFIITRLEQGYKVSFSRRLDNDAYVLSFTFKNVKGPYKGRTYIIQHMELDTALRAAEFAICVMVELGTLPDDKGNLAPNW
jgi:hypothetical protein